MQTTLTSVASAAVISGDLIIGLSDGSIINCGRVQGPQGLTGDQGPMGATGLRGTDGNTIHTVQGTPDTTLGIDGDFAINVVVWEIYGPRSGGVWGTGTPLRGNKRNGGSDQRDNLFGNNSQSEGGGGKTYNTSNLPLTGLGRLKGSKGSITAPGGNIIPEGNNLSFQANLNSWVYNSLAALDGALPVSTGSALPPAGQYEGDLFLKEGVLNVWDGTSWIEVGGNIDLEGYATEEWTEQKISEAQLEGGNTEQITYQIQTDKILRAGQPAIELVDSAGFYSNVKFSGTGGIGAASDMNGIIIDGSTLQKDKVSVVKYSIKDTEQGAGLGSRDGEVYFNSTNAKDVTLISFAPSDLSSKQLRPVLVGDIIELDINNGTIIRYLAEGSDSNVLTVSHIVGNRSLIKGDPVLVRFFPQAHTGARVLGLSNTWTPSNFCWEFDGFAEKRMEPDAGKFKIAEGGKDFICFSTVMANGQTTGNTLGSLNTYENHRDRLCLWHYDIVKATWKVFFDGLVAEWDSGSYFWSVVMDPISYGTKTTFREGHYFVTGGPF